MIWNILLHDHSYDVDLLEDNVNLVSDDQNVCGVSGGDLDLYLLANQHFCSVLYNQNFILCKKKSGSIIIL